MGLSGLNYKRSCGLRLECRGRKGGESVKRFKRSSESLSTCVSGWVVPWCAERSVATGARLLQVDEALAYSLCVWLLLHHLLAVPDHTFSCSENTCAAFYNLLWRVLL